MQSHVEAYFLFMCIQPLLLRCTPSELLLKAQWWYQLFIHSRVDKLKYVQLLYESKKIMHCNIITTTLQYFVKNYNCSTMLKRSCYEAAMMKLRSIITLAYSSIIMHESYYYSVYAYRCSHIYMHALNYATHGNIVAGLDSNTQSVLHLVSK